MGTRPDRAWKTWRRGTCRLWWCLARTSMARPRNCRCSVAEISLRVGRRERPWLCRLCDSTSVTANVQSANGNWYYTLTVMNNTEYLAGNISKVFLGPKGRLHVTTQVTLELKTTTFHSMTVAGPSFNGVNHSLDALPGFDPQDRTLAMIWDAPLGSSIVSSQINYLEQGGSHASATITQFQNYLNLKVDGFRKIFFSGRLAASTSQPRSASVELVDRAFGTGPGSRGCRAGPGSLRRGRSWGRGPGDVDRSGQEPVTSPRAASPALSVRCPRFPG